MTRTALITGASRGLGLALTRALADNGWRVVVTARGAEALAKATASVPGVIALPGDIADPAHRAALIETAGEGLRLLVNNASELGPMSRLAVYPLDRLSDIVNVNVVAPLALIQAALPGVKAVLNISSDAATGGYETWGGYGATKAALDQLSNVLAAEEPDIRVWWVDPGEMNTRMLAQAVGTEEASGAQSPEAVVPALLRLVTERLPSGRYQAAELAP